MKLEEMRKKTKNASIQGMEDKQVLKANLQVIEGGQVLRPKQKLVKKKSMLKEVDLNPLKKCNKETQEEPKELTNGLANKKKILNLHNKEEESDQKRTNPRSQRQSTSKIFNHSIDLYVEKKGFISLVKVEKMIMKMIEEKNMEFKKKIEVN